MMMMNIMINRWRDEGRKKNSICRLGLQLGQFVHYSGNWSLSRASHFYLAKVKKFLNIICFLLLDLAFVDQNGHRSCLRYRAISRLLFLSFMLVSLLLTTTNDFLKWDNVTLLSVIKNHRYWIIHACKRVNFFFRLFPFLSRCKRIATLW